MVFPETMPRVVPPRSVMRTSRRPRRAGKGSFGPALRDHLPGAQVVHRVYVAAGLLGEEPVHPGLAEQAIDRFVVMHRRRAEEVRAVQAAAEAATEVLDAGGVIRVGRPAPL